MRDRTMVVCPSCGLTADPRRLALSRTDNETSICERCGQEEAIRAAQGQPVTNQLSWLRRDLVDDGESGSRIWHDNS